MDPLNTKIKNAKFNPEFDIVVPLLNHTDQPKVLVISAKPPSNVGIKSSKEQIADVTNFQNQHKDKPTLLEKPSKNEKTGWKKYLGILLALTAAVLYSLSALIIKILMMNPLNFGAWRFLMTMVLPIPFLCHAVFWKKQKVFEVLLRNNGITTLYLVMQAIVGSNSIVLLFYALQNLNFADALVISTSAPVFVCILAFIFLGEKLGVFPIVLASLAICGVGIISRPPMITGAAVYDQNLWVGVCYSFTSMMCLATLYIILRFIRTVHHSLVNIVFSVVGFVECTFLAWYMEVLCVPTLYQALLLIASGFFGFSAATCITLAVKYEDAGPVSLVRTTEVVFAFIWQFLFLAVTPDFFSLLGTSLVILSAVLTALRKIVSTWPDDHKYRKYYRFLLF